MRKITETILVLVSITLCIHFIKADNETFRSDKSEIFPLNSLFLQTANINSVFRTDGIFNYDKVTFTNPQAGFIWPVSSSSRVTLVYSSGIWVGAKTVLPNNSKELRLAASFYNSHFSPGNIPVTGQIPPQSVCSDSAFSGFLVNLKDQSLFYGGVRTKSAGGRNYTFSYCSWYEWPVNLGAPYVEVNNIPGYQPAVNGDRPGVGFGEIKPDDIIFMVYMDYKNCSTVIHESEISLPGGTQPLGVEIHQVVYSFLSPGLTNSYITSFRIINKSSRSWDSTFVSLVNDVDIGDPSDDRVNCDSTINSAFIFNADDMDPEYGPAPPALGITLLNGPVYYTGNSGDTAKLPCSNKIGYKMMRMTGHNTFENVSDTCLSDPRNAVSGYNFMRSRDGCGNPIINPVTHLPTNFKYSGTCSGGWGGTTGDVRNMVSTGPFFMNSNDTQTISFLYVVGRGTNNHQSICEARENSVRIQQAFFDCFRVIGINQIGNTIPKEFGLEQNYPNPFNPVTKIRFSLPRSSDVKLTVYDLLGREVLVLLDEKNLTSGTYETDWDASGFPSGVYFYVISTGQYNESRKMILLK